MKISIITVCLNAKDTIEDTFLSVFNQTHEKLELIVIDGGSIDGTLEIIDKYKEKIAHFVSEPDKGIYDAMNKGIKAASGDFITFLNANDTFYDNLVLEKVAQVLAKNTEAEILFGNVECVSKNTQSSEILTFEDIKTDFSLISKNLCHQSVFYHKNLFKKFGSYSLQYKICSDWDFNIKCLVKNRVQALYVNTTIAKFQLGGISSDENSISNCNKERKSIIKKYYPKTMFFNSFKNFLKNNIPVLHEFIVQKCPIQKGLNYIASQDKHRLNIKALQDFS